MEQGSVSICKYREQERSAVLLVHQMFARVNYSEK